MKNMTSILWKKTNWTFWPAQYFILHPQVTFKKLYCISSIIIYPPYAPHHPAITTQLSMSQTPVSFLLYPSTPDFTHRWNLMNNLN